MAEERNSRGRFVKGHPGLKKKGSIHKPRKDLAFRAEKVAGKLGGRGGIDAYLENNPRLRDDLLRAAAAARAKAVPIDAAGNVVAPIVYRNELNILATPKNMRAIPERLGGGYCCTQLVRFLIAADRAKTLGPFDSSVGEVTEENDPPLTKAAPYRMLASDPNEPPRLSSPPMLRVLDSESDDDDVPPAA